jgi:hypothetical protein
METEYRSPSGYYLKEDAKQRNQSNQYTDQANYIEKLVTELAEMIVI